MDGHEGLSELDFVYLQALMELGECGIGGVLGFSQLFGDFCQDGGGVMLFEIPKKTFV